MNQSEINQKRRNEERESSRQWAANKFGIPVEDVIEHHSGICYNTIWVKSQMSADTVTSKVKGQVNGGMFDGMNLGGQTKCKEGTIKITC